MKVPPDRKLYKYMATETAKKILEKSSLRWGRWDGRGFWPVRSGWHFEGEDWPSRSRVRKRLDEQLKAERPHRGGRQPIETAVARWGLGAFAATSEAARVRVPSADP